jgi:Domain of unknown function (DUF5666)
MKTLRSTLFPLALVAAGLFAGCYSTGTGTGDVLGGGRTTEQTGSYDRLGSDVSGTVQRVSTRDRYIVVDEESGYRNNLRNGSQETYVYYDDRTTVDYQGKTFRPEDLEVGDRVAAQTTRSGDRLLAGNIQVLYDVSGGGTDTYRNDTYRDDTPRNQDLRGVVSSVDTRNRTLEVVPSRADSNYSRSDRVLVHYDSGTVVEFEGRQYQAENLERGDAVEVQIRDSGGQLLAERIRVTGEGQSVTR